MTSGQRNCAAWKSRVSIWSKPAPNVLTAQMLTSNRNTSKTKVPSRNPQPDCDRFLVPVGCISNSSLPKIYGPDYRMFQNSKVVAMNKVSKTPESNLRSTGIKLLFACLIVWTILIAAGSFWSKTATDYRRPLIVVGTMGLFLGVWAMALMLRKSREP